MTGDQLILLTIVLTFALPALLLGAGRRFVRHGIGCQTVDYVCAYVTTLLSIILLSIVLYLLPRLLAIWQSL